MLFRLFLLFTVVPAVELWLLIRIGGLLGPAPTVALVIGAGFLGAHLAKTEGWALIRQLQAEMAQGIPPADRLVEGLLVLVGAVMLISPGVLTDAVGLAIILPPIRRWLAPRLKRWLARRLLVGGGVAMSGQGFAFHMGGAAQAATERAEPEEPAQRPRFEHPTV